MRHLLSAPLLIAIATGSAAHAAGRSDLPAFGSGIKPRVMMQFDNSRSMLLAPDPLSNVLGDLTYADDDYDPDNNPGASCGNKLCIGKRVMSQVLPSYASLMEMGLATYYQYERTYVIPTGGGTTTCWYDVLAARGEIRNFSSYTDLGSSTSCQPSNCVNPAPYNTYNCTKVGTDYDVTEWYDRTHGSAVGVSTYLDSGRTWRLDSIESQPPGPPWDWYLVAKSPTCPTPTTYNAMYVENNRSDWGCTASTPCEMYYRDQVVTGTTVSLDLYQNKGSSYTPPPGSVTYTLSSSTLEEDTVGSPPCRGSYTETTAAVDGCSSSTPCDMTYLRTDSSTITDTLTLYKDQGPTYNDGSNVYSKTGATPQGPFEVQLTVAQPTCHTAGYLETGDWGCSSSNPCWMTYTGTRVVPGEIQQQFCDYQRTEYTYTASITNSDCIYQRTIYTYVAPGPDQAFCEYARYAYNFTAPVYTYQYAAYGGEIVDLFAATMDYSNYWCGTPYSSGYGPDSVCPLNANGWGEPCGVGSGRECPLYWRSPIVLADGGTQYPNGRDNNYTGSDPGFPSGCMAVDGYDGGVPQPNPAGYFADWCSGVGTTPGTVKMVVQATDYYNPSAANPADAGFPMDHKYSGWSRAEDGTQTPSLVFVPIDGGVIDPIVQAMKKYYPIDADRPNPMGIRTSNNDTYKDFTPLYGAAKNARDYFASLMASDPDVGCRNYYYLVVTDGQEYTPMNYSATDLQNVISSLRSIPVPGVGTKDVKTFVVGFGSLAQGGALDLMARAGGTAINPTTLRTDLVNGVALSAMDENGLTQALNLVFSYFANGVFTRSKPVLALNGGRVYAGYFRRIPGSQEWPGGLATYSIDVNGNVSPQIWDYGNQINTQASRTIYTSVPSNPGLIYFDTTASGANANPVDQTNLYTAMGEDQPLADSDITFLRDMSLAEMFRDGSQKTSRASDIYHAGPAVVGAANHASTWAGTDPAQQALYNTYKAATASRELTVYVGANDGMLHAIRDDAASTPASWAGTERWAFVPPPVLGKIPNSRLAHTFSVDGSLAIEDVCFGACAAATDWKTVLIGALREGGPALYSLDVTDPNNPIYLWTFYDGNLGNTFSAPVIAKLKANLTGSPVDKWVGILGGGLSSTPTDADYVYVIDALTGNILQDSSGTQARFQVEMDGLPKNNIPARVTIYRPLDGPYVSTVYFGDTQGRLNRMDLSGTSIPSWRPVRFFDPADVACKADIFGNPSTPILKASDGSAAGTLPLLGISTPPDIYARAVIAKDRTGRKMIFVGTGDSTDPTSGGDTNYFYALRDTDTGAVCSAKPAWVKRFDPGEKVVADPVVAGNSVILSTYLPPAAGSVCNDSGSAMLYSFDMASGAPTTALTDSRGNHVSKVTISGGGIVSDLAISGRSLVFNTSNNPTQVQTVSLNVGTSVSVRSWRRVR